MGPVSREAVCKAIGHLIDEAEAQRVMLQQIRSLLQRRGEEESEEIVTLQERVTKLERRLVVL